MEDFSRIDIYDTKGIEYLFVIGYLLVLIIFWRLSGRQIAVRKQFRAVLGMLTPANLKIPQGLFFNRNHTWAYLEDNGNARVGIDDFIINITGDVEIEGVKSVGEQIKKGELMLEVKQKDKHLKVFSPVSGKVMQQNTLMHEDPFMVQDDPYGNGWIYKIKPSAWINETSGYFLAGEATKWIAREIDRLKEFLTSGRMSQYASEPSMIMLQDGGELRNNILSELPGELWEEFQVEFLNVKEDK